MLSIAGVTKRYPHRLANDGITFDLPPGLHAILGENGAGKTTLLRILAGEERMDSGTITYKGKALGHGSPREASAAGVALVHQHPRLPPDLTFAEAISLGREPLRFGILLDRRKMLMACTEDLREYGGGMDPQVRLSSMGFASRQRVELLRAVSSGAQLIALDEPTSSLSQSEADELYGLLKRLDDGQRTILIVTHRIEEVLSRGMDCVVLREGRFQGMARESSAQRLSELMFGSMPSDGSSVRMPTTLPEDLPPTLSLEGLCVPSMRADDSSIHELSLSIRPGEVCALFALAGNGAGTLEDFLSARVAALRGAFAIDGRELTGRGMDERRKAGLGFVTGERRLRGLPREGSAMDAILEAERARFRAFPGMYESRMRARAAELSLPLKLEVDWDIRAVDLSGGESQRLILARETHAASRALVAFDPFLGLDADGRRDAHSAIKRVAERGVAVLLAGSDLDEAFELADRIIVLYRGRKTGEWTGSSGNELKASVAMAMAGMGEVAGASS